MVCWKCGFWKCCWATTSLFLYHLDYARMRLTTDSQGCSVNGQGQRQLKGLVDVYRKTMSTDEIAGLNRGFGVSIIGITLYQGLYFGIYDTLKPLVLIGPFEMVIEKIGIDALEGF